jgi:hypothetical protein
LRLIFGHILVVLGFRPPIASVLRSYIIPSTQISQLPFANKEQPSDESSNGIQTRSKTKKKTEHTLLRTKSLPSLDEIKQTLPARPSTCAYLIFSDGERTTVFEKDQIAADVQSSESFIVATNHDHNEDGKPTAERAHTKKHLALGMEDLLEESQDRKACIKEAWERAVKRYKRGHKDAKEDDVAITLGELVGWVLVYPITNEETNYAVIMDATEGEILWARQWRKAIDPPS